MNKVEKRHVSKVPFQLRMAALQDGVLFAGARACKCLKPLHLDVLIAPDVRTVAQSPPLSPAWPPCMA